MPNVMDIIIKNFNSQVKVGPVYSCTVYMPSIMYREGVVKIQVLTKKYLQCSFVSEAKDRYAGLVSQLC